MSSQAEYDSRRALSHRKGAEIGRQMRRDGAQCPVLPDEPSPDAVPDREALEEALRAAMREGLVEGWHEEDQALATAGEPAATVAVLQLDDAELEALRQLLAGLLTDQEPTRAERSLAAKVAVLVGDLET